MGLLIDSDVLIAYERERVNLSERIQAHRNEAFFVSVVTASELLHSVQRADTKERQAKRSAFVEAVLEQFPLLGIDLRVARAHARLWAALEARGLMIGVNDSWLAATCLAHDLTIATGNERHFRRVAGLDVEVWL